MKNKDWSVVLNTEDVNNAYDNFLEEINKQLETHCPIKHVKIKHRARYKPWITQGIKKSIKKKDNLYKQLKKNRTTNNLINTKPLIIN